MPATPPSANRSRLSPRTKPAIIWSVSVVLTIGLAGILASIGSGVSPLLSLAIVVDLVVRAGIWPVLYISSAIGLGVLFRPLTARASDPLALQAALGFALMLSLSHGLGVLGLLDGGMGRMIALAPVALGLVLLVVQLLDTRLTQHPERVVGPWIFIFVPGVAIMLAAACSPPGFLWASEAGGYDALSYHLQLPQEWIAAGRIWPVEHNVYSFLPGYIESAFVHLGAMMGASGPTQPGMPWGLAAGEGTGLITTQLLHVLIGLFGAWMLWRLSMLVLSQVHLPHRATAIGSLLCAALALSTPWFIVVGSLAYNELAVIVLFGAALLCAFDTALSPAHRGIVCGLLVGVACGAKPTSLLLVGPPVGIVLLGTTSPKAWAKIILPGAVAGLIALAPWLVRNYQACGNPVFPYMASTFGTGHWTGDQITNYMNAHSFDGTMGDRLKLMFLRPQPTDLGQYPQHRGLLHPQWFAFFPITLACLVPALSWPFVRRHGILISLGLGSQIVLWLTTTHIQARFLLPLIVPCAVLFAIACGRLLTRTKLADDSPDLAQGHLHPAAATLGVVAVLIQAGASLWIYNDQLGGRPGAMVIPGAGQVTGWNLGQLADVPAAQRREILDTIGSDAFINLELPDDAVVFLLGDATPLYIARPIVYNTTWDHSVFSEAVRAQPDTPRRWAQELAERGVTHVLINEYEMARLRNSGWYDPVVTQESVQRLMKTLGDPIQTWPIAGRSLFELRGLK